MFFDNLLDDNSVLFIVRMHLVAVVDNYRFAGGHLYCCLQAIQIYWSTIFPVYSDLLVYNGVSESVIND